MNNNTTTQTQTTTISDILGVLGGNKDLKIAFDNATALKLIFGIIIGVFIGAFLAILLAKLILKK